MKTQWKCEIALCVFGFLLSIPRTNASTSVPGDGQTAAVAESCNQEKGKATIVVASMPAVEVNETTRHEWKSLLKRILDPSLAISTTEMHTTAPTPTQPEDNGGGVSRRRRRRRETNDGNDNAYPKIEASTDQNGNIAFTVTLCGMTDEQAVEHIISSLPDIAAAWNIPVEQLEITPGSLPTGSSESTLSVMSSTVGAVFSDVTTDQITTASDGRSSSVEETADQGTTFAKLQETETNAPDPLVVTSASLPKATSESDLLSSITTIAGVDSKHVDGAANENTTAFQGTVEQTTEKPATPGTVPVGGLVVGTGRRYSEVNATMIEVYRLRLEVLMKQYGMSSTNSGVDSRRRRREIATTCDDPEIEAYQDENGILAFAISCPSVTSSELDEFLRIFAPQFAELLDVSVEQIVAFPSIRSTNSPETGESSVNDTKPRTGEGHGDQPNTTPPGNGQDYNYTYTPKDSFLQCDCRCKAP